MLPGKPANTCQAPKRKHLEEIWQPKKGIAGHAGQRGFFCEPAESVRCVRFSGGICSAVQRRQIRLYPGIADTQKLGGTGHGVDVKVLALGPLFVHELKYGIVRGRVLEDRAGDHKQGFPQMKGAVL